MKKFKPLTKTEIKKEVKKKITALKKIYNQLDVLMDDTEITAEGMTEKEVMVGKADEFNKIAGILQSARDNAQLAYDDLEMI